MKAAQTIRDAVARVTELRNSTQADSRLAVATAAIKRFQALRFKGTYTDLLESLEYGSATRFFLDELYGDKDFSQRDAQFARIASALQTFFPEQVVSTAVALAQLHALTEELDHAMAIAWIAGEKCSGDAARYAQAWRTVGREADRQRQLVEVLSMGQELDRLTRMPGLRLMLRMMRRPAVAADLGSLQAFLESGFDIFASMAGRGKRAKVFLDIIRERESAWITQLFGPDIVACEMNLRTCLDKAR